MDKYSNLLQWQLTEVEIMIYLLIESGMGYRDLGRRLGMSQTWVGNMYDTAEAKILKGRAQGMVA